MKTVILPRCITQEAFKLNGTAERNGLSVKLAESIRASSSIFWHSGNLQTSKINAAKKATNLWHSEILSV